MSKRTCRGFQNWYRSKTTDQSGNEVNGEAMKDGGMSKDVNGSHVNYIGCHTKPKAYTDLGSVELKRNHASSGVELNNKTIMRPRSHLYNVWDGNDNPTMPLQRRLNFTPIRSTKKYLSSDSNENSFESKRNVALKKKKLKDAKEPNSDHGKQLTVFNCTTLQPPEKFTRKHDVVTWLNQFEIYVKANQMPNKREIL
ncbi:hypothetical protein BpHYR1_023304, partial [Brachionus plicatilis]